MSKAPQYDSSGIPIVCLSVMDWDHPFPTSRHHLMSRFARDRRVLFVDQPANIVHAVAHAGDARVALKWRVWFGTVPALRRIESNLWGLTLPPIVPFGRLGSHRLFELLRRWNSRRVNRAVRQAADELGLVSPILWISLNAIFGEPLVGRLDECLVVYHCTDEVSTTPNLSRYLPSIEKEMLARADLTITSSRALAAAKRGHCIHTHFVPNGADVQFFERALDASTPVPDDLAALRPPRILFVGALDFRFDSALLARCAQARPDWSWVLVGPEDRATFDSASLSDLPNVFSFGLRPRELVPGYLRGCDAAIIPYRSDEHTRNVYPLKLHEYLAAGRPVVATPLPDLLEFEPIVRLASDPAGFVSALEVAIATVSGEAIAARVALARANDWSRRQEQIEELLSARLSEIGYVNPYHFG